MSALTIVRQYAATNLTIIPIQMTAARRRHYHPGENIGNASRPTTSCANGLGRVMALPSLQAGPRETWRY